jgi:MOSC domain-containing protein YiiM/SAM-dependent methyltransferase
MAIHEAAARGFASGADAYERGRPDYSPEAIEALVRELGIGPGVRVLDLAAGTGKLTRLLVATGSDLVAVEPIAEMRAKIATNAPGVEAIDGMAEQIPLPSHSVDAVVVGQAFHWFDGVRAISEIRRVLRPTGALGMIWQARDPARPWITRLNEIIDRADDRNPRYRTGAWRATFDLVHLFEPIEEAAFAYVHRADPATMVDRVASISYIAAMAEGQRRAVLDEVRELLATDPDTAGADAIELPYRAHVYWTRPRQIPAGPSTGVIVSVNVADGGVPKYPIAGTRIRYLGLDGDSHTLAPPIHGGVDQAVCLYAVEAIERVRADGHQAFPGAYGENLTLSGIDWGGLRTGDRFRIGRAGPLLELTHFAFPCQKQTKWFVEERIGRISPKLYPEDARWYASVVEEGPVEPGERIELIRTA